MIKYLSMFVGGTTLGLLLLANTAQAATLYSQSVTLSTGWNLISTPRVLESHTFSVAETSANFDIYILDASRPSGWATMADLGQTEFVPLYGYFVHNKTGASQTLSLNYASDVAPSDRLFSRTFTTTGWYSFGVANPTYAATVGTTTIDSDNPSHILSALSGSYSSAVDLTDGSYADDQDAVGIAGSWRASTASDVAHLHDLRETKGYAVFVTSSGALYNGFQNNALPECSDGADNDSDTNSDYPADTSCVSQFGNNESLTPPTAASITVANADTVPAHDISPNVSNTVLGGFVTDISGENVTVQTLVFNVATSSTGSGLLTNVSLVDSNGTIVAGPVDQAANGTITFTNTVTFPTGTHIYTIKGKVWTTASNGGTIILSANPSSHWTGVTGQTTGNTVTLPAGSFNMNPMAIRGAALAVNVSPTPAAQTIVAGSQDVVFANIQLDASQSGEDVRVSNLIITITNTGLLSHLTAGRVYDGSTILTTGSNIADPVTSVHNFTFDNPITVSKGTIKTLTVKFNVSSDATSGVSYKVGYTVGTSIIVTGVTSSSNVDETGSTNLGQLMTIGAGSLVISLDSSSPSSAIVAGGSTGVALGAYKFRASNDNVQLQRIGLVLTSGAASDLTSVTIWQGSTQIGTAIFAGGTLNATSTLSSPITLTKDTDVVITVKGDVAGIGSALPGTSGHTIKVNVDTNSTNTQGVGVGSGLQVNATGSTAVSGVTIYHSFPVVAQDTSGIGATGVADGKLIRFRVTANSAGSIGIGQVAWSVSTSSATVQNVKLYAYTDSSYSTPVSGQAPDGQVGSTLAFPSGAVTKTAVVSNPVQVAAGQTIYFELRADVVPTTGASVVTKIFGDAAAVAPATLGGQSGQFFAWTPNTLTTSATTTADFVNGAFVTGLPSAGITQARGL